MPALRSALAARRTPQPLHLELGKDLTLTVVAPGARADEARAVAIQHRERLDSYLVARRDPTEDQLRAAPRVVALAASAAEALGVPPSATARGALLQAVGEDLAARLGEATVETGGMWFVASRRRRDLVLQGAGPSFALQVERGVAVSALSSAARREPLPGRADALAIVASNAGLLEPAAAAAGKMIRRLADVSRALAFLRAIEGIRGALILGGPAVAVFGGIRIDAR